VLRRILGTDEEEVAGGRRKLHNELLNLHLLDMIGKIKKWTVRNLGEKRLAVFRIYLDMMGVEGRGIASRSCRSFKGAVDDSKVT
jgi:hypothetical protein